MSSPRRLGQEGVLALQDNPSLIRSDLARVAQALREWAIDPEVEEQFVAAAWAIYRDPNTKPRTRMAAGKLGGA